MISLFFPIVLFTKFEYLSIYLLLILIINLNSVFKFSSYQKNILKVYITFGFLKRYFFDIRNERNINSLNSDIFWDLQLFFLQLKCNLIEDFSYNFQFSNNLYNCLTGGPGHDGQINIGFGPLSKVMIFNTDIWIVTLIISIVLGLLVLSFVTKFKLENNLFSLFLVISPSFIFLFDTMNLDLVIFIISCLFIYCFKNWNLIFLIILSFFSMLKLYPIAFIAGITLFNFLNRNYKQSLISSVFLLGNGFYILYNYIFNEFSLTEKPYAPVRTFGITSDYLAINKYFGYEFFQINHVIAIFLMFFLFIGILVFNKESVLKPNITNTFDKKVFIICSPTAIVIALFANYSYKLIFFFLIASILEKTLSKSEKTIIYYLFFTSPLILIFGISGGYSFIEFLHFISNRLCGYYFLFLIFKNLYFIFKQFTGDDIYSL